MKVKLIITPETLTPVDGQSFAYTSVEGEPFETELEFPDGEVGICCEYAIDGNELSLDQVMSDMYGVITEYLDEKETELGISRDRTHHYDWDLVDGNLFEEEVKALAQKWLDEQFREYISDAETVAANEDRELQVAHIDGNTVYYKIKVEPWKIV